MSTVNKENFEIVIHDALAAWQEGKLVAMPTETVYGLGAPVNSESLVKKIFEVKERPFFDPLIVHVSSVEMAKRYGRDWSADHEKLVEKFWPGPLTIVFPKTEAISALITSGLETVGLRCPDNNLTRELIAQLDVGVAAPSANKFTKTSPTKSEHVSSQFSSDDVYVIDNDPSQVGIESTIVTIKEGRVHILRPGVITSTHLKEALGQEREVVQGKTAFEDHNEKVSAPGQFKVHYRPDYELALYKNESDDFDMEALKESDPTVDFVVLDINPLVTARHLYSLMRVPLEPSKRGRCFVIVTPLHRLKTSDLEIWQGILNRLSKAITFTIENPSL